MGEIPAIADLRPMNWHHRTSLDHPRESVARLCPLCRIERGRERFRKLPDQRLSGDGSMVARYDMDLHVALGQTTPTQSRIHGEVGQQLHTRAEQYDWHRGRHWPIGLQRSNMGLEHQSLLWL